MNNLDIIGIVACIIGLFIVHELAAWRRGYEKGYKDGVEDNK